MSYTITIEREGWTRESIMRIQEREEAMSVWDDQLDCALGGEVFTLRSPEGKIISQYKPAMRSK